jgi:hypothetical protein
MTSHMFIETYFKIVVEFTGKLELYGKTKPPKILSAGLLALLLESDCEKGYRGGGVQETSKIRRF